MTGEKLMREIFDRYRKAIITGGGVLVFILAGLVTMLISQNETPNSKPSSPKTQASAASLPSQKQTAITPPPSQETAMTSRIVYAYITGEVMKPGVYKLSDDARIFQLVDMAGGFTPNADRESLNLAEVIADGAHIHIGAQSQATRGQSPTISGMPARNTPIVQPSSSLVNINTATASQLESLPGVGKVTAQRIIDYRNTHGNFDSPEDLVNVRGISWAKLEAMKDMITVR